MWGRGLNHAIAENFLAKVVWALNGDGMTIRAAIENGSVANGANLCYCSAKIVFTNSKFLGNTLLVVWRRRASKFFLYRAGAS